MIRRWMRAVQHATLFAPLLAACHLESETPTAPPTPTPISWQHLTVAAFPGAEGWGATALNASRNLPLEVHFVTSRKSTGAGTLAEAINNTSDDKYDIIIFRTGGLFDPPDAANGGLRLDARHVYIAGQTAPGDGVAIDGGQSGTTFHIRTGGQLVSDNVIRYLRILNPRTGINIHAGNRIVIDHVSVGWSSRYPVQLSRRDGSASAPISGVVIQNTLLHSARDEHPTGITMNHASGDIDLIGMTDISVHRNLFAHNDRRNPRTGADNSLIANNVIYNWTLSATDASGRGIHDFVNNLGKHGPMSRASHPYVVTLRCDQGADFSIYAAGNVGPASSDANGNNWTGASRQVACYHNSGDEHGEEVPPDFRRQPHQPQAWQSATFPVTMRSASQAYQTVLANAGANVRLACDGRWVNVRDAIDNLIIQQVTDGTGPSSASVSAGDIPHYAPGTPCPDTDGDGLPDAWEERFFGCATCADPSARGRNGYLVIEHYLNGTTPQ